MSSRSPLLPVDTFLTFEPDRTVVHGTLGLTIYLDDARGWALSWIPEVFASFAARVHPDWLRWYMTSQEARWRPMRSVREVVDALGASQLTGRVRHLLTVRVSDDRGAPRVGFVYREVDPTRTSASAYLQAYFPVNCDPNEVLAFAIEIAQSYPFIAGIAGYAFSWNPELPFSAFRAIYSYAHRFLGVDVQHPEASAWAVRGGLPGVNWLTLIGTEISKGMAPPLHDVAWSHDVRVLGLAHGLLIQADATPCCGDLNMMEYPSAIAEVTRRLQPLLMKPAPSLPGPFEENDNGTSSRDWFYRFIAPEAWP